jgi:transcription initiation factor TFIIE subunit alpha
MAVKGLTNTGPQSIAVNISTSEGQTEAEKEAERARKERIAKQNALPSWMSNSTVTGESFSGSTGIVGATAKQEADSKATGQGKSIDHTASAQIDDIFEKLKAEQAAERAREAEEEDEEEEGEYGSDEDEGDFEDVPATGNTSGMATPGTPAIKREASGDNDGDSSDERQAKRVKVEPGIKREEEEKDSDEDEDEELEFEDV